MNSLAESSYLCVFSGGQFSDRYSGLAIIGMNLSLQT